ncbi:MAG: ATP-binding cassette domain-containing protein [Hyphomonadaceae bacterium]
MGANLGLRGVSLVLEGSEQKPLMAAARVIAEALDGRAMLSAGAGIAAMLLSGLAITTSAALLAFALTPGAGDRAAMALISAVALGVVAQALDVAKWRCHADAELRLEQALTQSTFERSIGAPIGYGVGAQMQALANALLGARLLFQHLVFTAPTALIATAASSTLLAGLGHLSVAAAMLGFAAVYLASATWRAMPMVRVANRASRARIDAGRRFADALTNREVVRAFAATRFVGNSLKHSLRRVLRFTSLLATLRACAAGMGVMVSGTGMSMILWLAWESAATPTDRLALLVLVSITTTSLMRPMEMAANAFRDLIWARALVVPLIAPVQTAAPMSDGSGAPIDVRLNRVSVRHQRDRHILQNASFYCAAGSKTGLCGDSGAGKSTLIRLLTGEISPHDGAVLLGGVCASSRSGVSVALQEVLLLDATVRENIAFGRAASSEEIERVVNMVGLGPLVKSLPNGLASRVGERGMRLSGGERQRVALARAMLKPAPLYLFDEATSALPPEAESAIMGRIVASAGDATMIVVAHRQSAFVGMDRIFELGDGGFIERRPAASHASARIGPLSRERGLQSPEAKT